MSKLSSPAWMMAAFFAGIFFVYSCGGEGDYANIAIGVQGGVPALTDELDVLKQRVAELERKLAAVADDRTTLMVTGRNVQIVSGSGATDDNGSLTGLGNLIIGYNETGVIEAPPWSGFVRTGSHNLVIGVDHSYESYGGLVAGQGNRISGISAVVSGGMHNWASYRGTSVSGGWSNTAGNAGVGGPFASVSGGHRNTAVGNGTSVSGGEQNTASDRISSVSGGRQNTASAAGASVSGGEFNTASRSASSVSGGYKNTATSGFASSVSGGTGNTASGRFSSVSGGSTCIQTSESGWTVGLPTGGCSTLSN